MTGKTIAEMTAEVRECNQAHGWREGSNTFGDYIALLHSEASEALEAFRDHKTEDATEVVPVTLYDPKGAPVNLPKPEGVGSELADVLIRLLDMADVYGLDLDFEYERKIAYNRTRPFKHGGRAL